MDGGRIVPAILAMGLAAAGAIAYGLTSRERISERAPPPAPRDAAAEQTAEAAQRTPKLYCQFYVFTEQRPRVAFYFDVLRRDGEPVFQQIYVAEDNGARTDFDGETTPRPEWRFDPATDPRTLASRIDVPDSSQSGTHQEDIVIELYGYAPDRASSAFFEASLKNVHFQTLPGKCRQTAG